MQLYTMYAATDTHICMGQILRMRSPLTLDMVDKQLYPRALTLSHLSEVGGASCCYSNYQNAPVSLVITSLNSKNCCLHYVLVK